MNLALDTNAYSDFLRGDPSRVNMVQGADRIFLPLIVLAELRAGFAAGSREPENIGTLRKFLSSPRVALLLPDETTAEHYARVFLQLRRQGTPIPTNDLWIAALALQHGLALCTADVHFQHVAALRLC